MVTCINTHSILDAPGMTEKEVSMEANSGPDVGATGEAFPYWAAQEALKTAEVALAETDKSRESLGKTATSLIGWALPLSVVFGGVVFAPTLHMQQRTGAAAGFVLTTAAVLCAFQAVRVRNWANSGLSPDQWLHLIEHPPAEASALYITLERLKSLNNALHRNDQLIATCGKFARVAWVLLLAMPAIAFLCGLITTLVF